MARLPISSAGAEYTPITFKSELVDIGRSISLGESVSLFVLALKLALFTVRIMLLAGYGRPEGLRLEGHSRHRRSANPRVPDYLNPYSADRPKWDPRVYPEILPYSVAKIK